MSHCQPAQRLSIQSSIHHEMWNVECGMWNQLAELFKMQPHMGKGFTKPKHFKENQLTTQGYLFLFTIWPGHRFSTKPV